MNSVLQFRATLTPGTVLGVLQFAEVRLGVPDGFALRVRHVRFVVQGFPGASGRFSMGVSYRNRHLLPNTAAVFADKTFLGYEGAVVVTASAIGFNILSNVYRIEMWDYDYRLVMNPTFVAEATFAGQQIECIVAGELVRATQGDRNAIIVWQGGVQQ